MTQAFEKEHFMMQRIRQFMAMESSGGIFLIIAAALALLIANSVLVNIYDSTFHLYLGFYVGGFEVKLSVLHWINDALMAIFFLVVGLEVKRELLVGALASKDRAMFPLIAAIGGIIAPALVYSIFNIFNPETRGGWAIPTATDIAFAVGVLSLLGSKIPSNLKIFLLALAIIDDLGAILIIALFYTKEISYQALGVAGVATLLLTALNLLGIKKLTPYMIIGAVLWLAFLKSGVHATIAGVILGFSIPLRDKSSNTANSTNGHSVAENLEHTLHPWVTWLVLPIFAFANSGINLSGIAFNDLLSPLPLGIALGLILGKPLGIYSFCWFAVKKGWAKLPKDVNFSHIFGVSIICGIGFTMSIFIGLLAFEDASKELVNYAKLGILVGSIISGVVGYICLRFFSKTSVHNDI